MASGNPDERSLAVLDYKRRFLKKPCRKFILSCLECGYGLKDEIDRRNILSEIQWVIVREYDGRPYKQNKILLEMICQGSNLKQYEDFLECLTTTSQDHLRRYIQNNGEVSDSGRNRPITCAERTKLRRMRGMLVESLLPAINDILKKLLQNKCISEQHYREILRKDDYEKAQLLLEIIERRSFQDYKVFFETLEITDPPFVSLLIDGRGVCTAVDIDLASCSREIFTSLIEDQIVEVIMKKPDEEIRKIFDRFQPILHGNRLLVSTKHNTRIYFYCISIESLRAIRRGIDDGQMKKFLHEFFNTVLGNGSYSTSVRVECVSMVDYSMQEFYMQVTTSAVDFIDRKSSHKVMRNGGDREVNMKKVFCHESLYKAKERILLYSYLWRVSKRSKYSSGSVVDAVFHLSSVCQDWSNATKRLTFEGNLRRELKKHDTSVKLTLVSNMIFDHSISCLTHLFRDICIVTRDRPNVIQVIKQFSSHPDDRVSFNVGDRLKISYMEASENENGIFCVDETDGSVWFWSRGHTEGCATSMKQFSPCTYLVVSPVDQQRILLNANNGIIEIHDEFSKFIQVLRLPNHVEKPLSILSVTCNNKRYILVSHGSNNSNQHRICMMNLEGSVELTYGDERGGEPNQLNHPSSLTLDDENDIVFVADKENHRVLALDNKLRPINVVLDEKHDYLDSPTSVCYAKYKVQVSIPGGKDDEIQQVRRLIVASEKSISIYGFQN